ncbi:MAG TPA: HEPN domain-containing protein, partial [Thermodesulfobacteriota bacterium]|nr:HEPN domain-containing protein [Thermodesulfobacteriota bacterium]
QSDRLFSTLNRIYYALFYEVAALLLTADLSSAKHTGIRALFNEHFVRAGKVPVELGRFYSRMYDFRQKSDYGDFVEFEREKVKEWLDQASMFINEMDRIIENEKKI